MGQLCSLKFLKASMGDISEAELKLYLAIMLYKERKLSVGQAAKLAKISPLDFRYELRKHKVSFCPTLPLRRLMKS